MTNTSGGTLIEEQLFEWETTKKTPRTRKTSRTQEQVTRPPGYHLVSSASGIQGFHRTRVPEAAMARHGSCVTLCGIVGRRVGEYPEMIPLCDECELQHRTGRG